MSDTTTATPATITYAKLSDGSWGLRVTGKPPEGRWVTVVKRDGTKKEEVCGSVVWSGDGVHLCKIVQTGRASAKTTSRSCRPGQMCPRCGSEPLNAKLHCWECGFTGK